MNPPSISTVFLLNAHTGRYDDYSVRVVAVHLSEETANSHRAQAEQSAEALIATMTADERYFCQPGARLPFDPKGHIWDGAISYSVDAVALVQGPLGVDGLLSFIPAEELHLTHDTQTYGQAVQGTFADKLNQALTTTAFRTQAK